MKKILWTWVVALAAAVCMTACDDSCSDAADSVPEYKAKSSLPGSCDMEVAKVADSYFACFENKWIEVTDSATVEQLKEGLDESKIKEILEEVEDQLVKSSSSSKKSGSGKVGSSSSSSEKSGSGKVGSSSSSSSMVFISSDGSQSSSSRTRTIDEMRNSFFSFLDEYVVWEDGPFASIKSGVDIEDVRQLVIDNMASFTDDIEDSSYKSIADKYGLTHRDFWHDGDFIAWEFSMSTEDSVIYHLAYYQDYGFDGTLMTAEELIGLCGTESYSDNVQYCKDGELMDPYDAVILAVKTNDVDMLQDVWYLDRSNIGRCGSDGYYPIHWAVKKGNYEAMMFLIDKGVDVNAKSANGWSALDWATEEGYTRLIKALKKAGAKNTAKYYKEQKT